MDTRELISGYILLSLSLSSLSVTLTLIHEPWRNVAQVGGTHLSFARRMLWIACDHPWRTVSRCARVWASLSLSFSLHLSLYTYICSRIARSLTLSLSLFTLFLFVSISPLSRPVVCVCVCVWVYVCVLVKSEILRNTRRAKGQDERVAVSIAGLHCWLISRNCFD